MGLRVRSTSTVRICGSHNFAATRDCCAVDDKPYFLGQNAAATLKLTPKFTGRKKWEAILERRMYD